MRRPTRTGICRRNAGIPGPVNTCSCPQISSGLGSHRQASSAGAGRRPVDQPGARSRAAYSRSGVVSHSLTARMTSSRRLGRWQRRPRSHEGLLQAGDRQALPDDHLRRCDDQAPSSVHDHPGPGAQVRGRRCAQVDEVTNTSGATPTPSALT